MEGSSAGLYSTACFWVQGSTMTCEAIIHCISRRRNELLKLPSTNQFSHRHCTHYQCRKQTVVGGQTLITKELKHGRSPKWWAIASTEPISCRSVGLLRGHAPLKDASLTHTDWARLTLVHFVSLTRTNVGDKAFSAAGPSVWSYICRQTSDSRTCHAAVSYILLGLWDQSAVVSSETGQSSRSTGQSTASAMRQMCDITSLADNSVGCVKSDLHLHAVCDFHSWTIESTWCRYRCDECWRQ